MHAKVHIFIGTSILLGDIFRFGGVSSGYSVKSLEERYLVTLVKSLAADGF